MNESFFERPILNSPYRHPGRHWELDADGQPTSRIIQARRRSELITPVPKPKKRRQGRGQVAMAFDAGDDLSSKEQEYNPTPIINEIRTYVEVWRKLLNSEQWLVTPETARLLKHWRSDAFEEIRPFFCQVEAVETAIWLTEVAPKMGARYRKFWDHIRNANAEANPELLRLALKLATGAGKTTVMAMIIAWQEINAARHPGSKTFSRGFLVVAPGITIRDRLRVLQPNDPDSYYRYREIVPPDMLGEIDKAKIVITNYHAFKLRERLEVAKGTVSVFNGPPPAVRRFKSVEDESNAIGAWIAERIKEGTRPEEIGVFVRSDAEVDRARAAAKAAGASAARLSGESEAAPGMIAVSPMHLAKGLEFRAVAVMACDDEILPQQERIETVADDSELEEVYNTERHLLYVACTRARDHLIVSGVEPVSEFLADFGPDRGGSVAS